MRLILSTNHQTATYHPNERFQDPKYTEHQNDRVQEPNHLNTRFRWQPKLFV